jgi:hypothetical protein
MKSQMRCFANQNTKRARATARRLTRILRDLKSNPSRNFRLYSEAATLAEKVSYFLRESETGGRIILTEDEQRRQFFLVDRLKEYSICQTGGTTI